jgi:hypothetical protein
VLELVFDTKVESEQPSGDPADVDDRDVRPHSPGSWLGPMAEGFHAWLDRVRGRRGWRRRSSTTRHSPGFRCRPHWKTARSASTKHYSCR